MKSLSLLQGFSSPGFDRGESSDFDKTVDLLWDALRMECCSSKLEAKAIVIVKKRDLIAALRALANKD